jgi:hypothetical protein
MHSVNTVIQSTCVDLLQVIVARGEVDNLLITNVEAAVIQKLYFCVHVARLDLQNKLLHLLHSLISISISNQDAASPKNVIGRSTDIMEPNTTQEGSNESATRSYTVNPLLVQTLIDGISMSTNRPVLQHWLDFVLLAIPQFQQTLHGLVAPINDCLCRQLLVGLADVQQASQSDSEELADIVCTSTDVNLLLLLNGLERLTLLCLSPSPDPNTLEEDVVAEKSGESSGLLGYMSNVFSTDHSHNPEEDQFTVSCDSNI